MITVSIPPIGTELKPRITVFGVGGAGGNAVNNMIKSNLEGVDFVVGNTDAQALKGSLCEKRLQLGTATTRGLGAGSKPDVGRAAAEEQVNDIVSYLDGSNMVFITAGMGGGTGTGAAPVIARAARERGILTIGVVTKPFHFEGAHRMRLAESGIAELQQYVDTLIIIPNQNLFRIANEKTTFADAFKMADDVLHSGVRGVTDLMVMPGLINLDFADIRSVMTEMGKAMMGTGEAMGDRRAIEAAEAAISNPLLDDMSMKGARGVLINITGGYDMTLFEVDEAANRIRDEVDADANIIFGSTFDSSLEGTMRVSVVATGIDAAAMAHPRASAHSVNPSAVSDRMRKPAPQAAVSGIAGLASAAPMPAVATASALKAQPIATTATAFAMEVPVAAPIPVAYEVPAAQPVAAPATTSTGSLHAERRDGAFIPPKAVDPGPRPLAAGSTAPAVADTPDAQARKRMSLFGLVTGLGRSGRKEEISVPQPAPQPAPIMPAPAPQMQPPPVAAPQQPSLGIQVAPQTKMHAAEEDVLDIPAFLRRQADGSEPAVSLGVPSTSQPVTHSAEGAASDGSTAVLDQSHHSEPEYLINPDVFLQRTVERMKQGHIAVAARGTMVVGDTELVQVAIGWSGADVIAEALQVDCVPQISETRVHTFMRVEVFGNAFKIKAVSPIDQAISADRAGVWTFDVTPLKKGTHALSICASARIILPNRDREELVTLPLVVRKIDIKVSYRKWAADAIRKNWKKIVIAGPVALAGYLASMGPVKTRAAEFVGRIVDEILR